MRRAWVLAGLALAGCSSDPVTPADDVLDLRLTVETPVVREGDRLDAELVVTNRGKLPVSLSGAGCPAQLWVRDDRGNATGQPVGCTLYYEERWVEPGETTVLPRFWYSLGAWPGQYFAVAYMRVPPGRILYSDTVAISVEPASP